MARDSKGNVVYPLVWKSYPKGGKIANYKIGKIVATGHSFIAKIGKEWLTYKTLQEAKDLIDYLTNQRQQIAKGKAIDLRKSTSNRKK